MSKDNVVEEDPVIMYLIFRESLLSIVSIGKLAAQIGHGVQYLIDRYISINSFSEYWTEADYNNPERKIFLDWYNQDNRKVVLKADEKEWEKLKNDEFIKNSMVLVIDKGLTELPPQTETVIGLIPMRKNEVPKIIKKWNIIK